MTRMWGARAALALIVLGVLALMWSARLHLSHDAWWPWHGHDPRLLPVFGFYLGVLLAGVAILYACVGILFVLWRHARGPRRSRISVADARAFHKGDELLVGGEKMRVVDVSDDGRELIVEPR